MRVLVTGGGNPTGKAIVAALVADGHNVRLFGVGPEASAGITGPGSVEWYPGDLQTGGSIEPVLSEREALIHVAALDAPGPNKKAHAAAIERGTLYARYGAEREQVDHFIHISPGAEGSRTYAEAQRRAVAIVEGTRGTIHWQVLHNTAGAEETARMTLEVLRQGGRLGKQPGRDTDAVTA